MTLLLFMIQGIGWEAAPHGDDRSPMVSPESQTRSRCEFNDAEREWRQWRGPWMTGVAPQGNPPDTWSDQKNVKWKARIDGLGHSTPIVTGAFVFLTYARKVGDPFPPRPDTAPGAHDNKRVSSAFEFVAAAFDRESGQLCWQRVLHTGIPHEGAHVSASLASASAVTDGKRVWFQFGSYGLYCLDFEGNTIWQRNFGRMNTKHGHGEGASPVLSGELLALNWDHEGQSFVVVLNKDSGETVWRRDRDEVTSWSSPIVVEHDQTRQLIVAGTHRIRSYDLTTGSLIWQCGGMSHNIVATPVAGDGYVYFGSSYEIRQMLAIKLDGAQGDITSTDNVVWSRNARTPYVPSPLLVEGQLYFLRHYQGVMSRLVAKTGDEPSGPFRLAGLNEIYASPVSAAGKIFVTDRSGTTEVLTVGEQPRRIAVNRLDDRFSASAAIAGDELFLRGERFLFCVAEQ